MYERNSQFMRSIPQVGTGEVGAVLRNTYLMLALTLVFSAICSGIAMMTNAQPVNIFITLVVIIGFPFLLNRIANSPWALVVTFAYTGFIGWMLGPILNFYIKTFSNGPSLIMLALGSTGLIFLGLSAIALNPKRNFNGIGSFLFVGMIVAFIASLVNVFFLHMPALQLALSVIFALISGGYILFTTNAIIHGGCRNYIIATVMLYVSLVNIFMTLLQILALFGGNRN